MTFPTSHTRAHHRGFGLVAFAFLVSMAFSTIPTPLYTIYQATEGFAPWVVTVIFGAYAVGVMVSLLAAGHVSDGWGRRRVLLAAIALNILSALVFLASTSLAALLAARLVNGLGIGLLTATATAALAELRGVSHGPRGTGTASLVSTMANMGGLALGPLVSGALAQCFAAPLEVPYVVFLILLVASAAAVALVPETVRRPEVRPAYHPQWLVVAPGVRSAVAAASLGAFGTFAVLGLFSSLAPVFLARDLHESSKFVAGLVTFGVFGAGTLAQVALVRLKARLQLDLGLVAIAVGLAAVLVAVWVVSAPVFLVGGLAAGAGVGLVFRTAIQLAAHVSPPETRGGVMAAVFLVAYGGLTVPVVGLGVSLLFVSTPWALLVFVFAILAVLLAGGLTMAKHLEKA